MNHWPTPLIALLLLPLTPTFPANPRGGTLPATSKSAPAVPLARAKDKLLQKTVLDPENPEPLLQLALIALNEGDQEKCRQYLEKGRKLRDSGEIHYYQGLSFLKEGKIEAAIQSFTRGSTLFPEFQGNFTALDKTRLAQEKNNPPAPLTSLQQFWEKGKGYPGICLYRARFLLETGKLDMALEQIEQVQEHPELSQPLRTEARFLNFLAKLYNQQYYPAKTILEELGEAIPRPVLDTFQSLREVCEENSGGPREAKKYQLLGTIAERVSHFGLAIGFFRQGYSLDGENISLLFSLASLYMKTRQYSLAETTLSEIAEKSHHSLDSKLNLLKFHLSGVGSLEKGRKIIAGLAGMNSPNPELRFFRGLFAVLDGDTKGGGEILQSLAATSHAEPFKSLAEATLRKIGATKSGDTIKLKRELLRLIHLPPALEADDYQEKGEYFLKNQLYFYALKCFDKINHNYRLSEVYFAMANRLEDMKDPLAAELCEKFGLNELLEAVKKDPHNPVYHLQLANYYHFKGFTEQARTECRAILTLPAANAEQKGIAGELLNRLN